jgi:hypothetical protein
METTLCYDSPTPPSFALTISFSKQWKLPGDTGAPTHHEDVKITYCVYSNAR